MKHLQILAGPHALRRLREEGVHAEQFRVLLGASGGPKWFVLYGLDRYLFGEFFRERQTILHTLGSSAGAWRMCCLATADPVAAIERLAKIYSNENYGKQPTVAEITDKARAMLQAVLGAQGAREIVENPIFKTHIIADRCKGLGSSHNQRLQMLALGAAAMANLLNRRTLSWFFQRTLFSSAGESSPWLRLKDLDTQLAPLTTDNVFAAMMASGSIPFALAGERDIAGAQNGLYWDGGITDYHFDLPFYAGDELVLYPHFYSSVIPGWFDKHLPWRRPHAENFRNVVLLAPSAAFVASLPYGKIPDRTDFKTLDYQSRQRYWQRVLDLSRYIADDFAQLVEAGNSHADFPVHPLVLR
ncbi:MAG: patatin-like phospholipase family protein [Gammaproteobacteria bacterium]|nr:patatin-like phospholipase family protein [Gammaproteobacteria bacterium]